MCNLQIIFSHIYYLTINPQATTCGLNSKIKIEALLLPLKKEAELKPPFDG